MKLTTVTQMRAIEKEADRKGLTYATMMQNAGQALAEVAEIFAREAGWQTVTGIVGSGNNGGDTLIALTRLAKAGMRAHAYLVNRSTTNDRLITQYLQAGGDLTQYTSDTDFESLWAYLGESDLLLDGLLGTGIKLPLKQEAALVLDFINIILAETQNPPFVIAVDCPSGVDCDSGECAPETVVADLTLCMAAVKHGLLKLPAFQTVGELQVIGIGLPENLDSWKALDTDVADWEAVAATLPERNPASHKGTFGTALVTAGSASYTGAALLAAEAAYRIGAGLVTIALPEPLHPILAGHLPEATWLPLPHENGFISEAAAPHFIDNLARPTAILIGPGLGDKPTTRSFIEKILPSIHIPLVLDADALRHISPNISPLLLRERPGGRSGEGKNEGQTILTPHPGEMSAMTGLSRQEIQTNREAVASKYATEWGCVIVLKGAFTVIAAPDGRKTVIPVATPALARAGTGDVLAGLIVGLRAQGVEAYEAAIAGAFIHAQAGLRAAQEHGATAPVLARDVLTAIPQVLADLE